MDDVLKQFLEAVAKAREENNVKALNCLVLKQNLVKRLIKASQRANDVLLEAAFAGDAKTTDLYAKRVDSYEQFVREVGKSKDKCLSVNATAAGTTTVYIRPKTAGEAKSGVTGPWEPKTFDGSENYPVVPPGSPFR